MLKQITKHVRGYFFAGLLIWLPLLATLFVIRFILDILDGSLALIPEIYQPEKWLGFHIPGLGVVISIVTLIVTGILATNFLGHKLFAFGESILARIPFVRAIYNAVKQVLETLFSSGSDSFKKVLLIEYPRKEMWTVAFQTASSNQMTELPNHENMVSVYVPTTPNPSSGFLIFVPRTDVIELALSVDEALKMVISLGVIQPGVAAKALLDKQNSTPENN